MFLCHQSIIKIYNDCNYLSHLVVELFPSICECAEEMVLALAVELHSHIVECYQHVLGTEREQGEERGYVKGSETQRNLAEGRQQSRTG